MHQPGSYYIQHTSVCDELEVCDVALSPAPGAQCCQNPPLGSIMHKQRGPIGRHSSAWQHRHELDTCSMQHHQQYPPDIVDIATGPLEHTVPRSTPGGQQGCSNHRRGSHWHLYTRHHNILHKRRRRLTVSVQMQQEYQCSLCAVLGGVLPSPTDPSPFQMSQQTMPAVPWACGADGSHSIISAMKDPTAIYSRLFSLF